jgi:hypothetical protein
MGNLTADHLQFAEQPPQRIDVFGPHLRLAMIRGERDEVPQ